MICLAKELDVFLKVLVIYSKWDILQKSVDKKVHRRIKSNQSMRQMLDGGQPVGPSFPFKSIFAVNQFVNRRNQFPDMANDKEPNDENGNSRQSTFFFPSQVFVVLQKRILVNDFCSPLLFMTPKKKEKWCFAISK